MVAVMINMTVLPEKRHEMLLTLDELIKVMRQEAGLLDARLCVNESSNMLSLVEEWKTLEQAHAYMQSEYFRVLRGALKLLTAFSEVTLFTLGEIQDKSIHILNTPMNHSGV